MAKSSKSSSEEDPTKVTKNVDEKKVTNEDDGGGSSSEESDDDYAHKDADQIKEHFCDEATLDSQVEQFVQLVKHSRHFVAFTGAGVSTSAGIPDFRGPTGVWTMRAQGKVATATTDTLKASPTPSHMSLVSLEKAGILKFLISQNVDGLHRRSGFPTDKLAELHGNSNLEFCKKCKKEYFRDFDTYAGNRDVHDHRSGRTCTCGDPLYDSIINFGENLPEKALKDGFRHAVASDVFLVLGSSLTVTPAADMPRECVARGGKLVICNLQKTPLDDSAFIRVFAKTDDFMTKVMQKSSIAIDKWKLIRRIIISTSASLGDQISMTVTAVEPDGTPASILSAVRVKEISHAGAVLLTKEPFVFSLSTNIFSFKCLVELRFMGNFNEPPISFEYSCDRKDLSKTNQYLLSYDPRTGIWEFLK